MNVEFESIVPTEPTEDMLMDQLISDGIQFVKSLTDYYGPEKGMEVWNAMGESMGQTVHRKVFMAMLMGQSTMTVRFMAGDVRNRGNFVAAIKCVRTYTGFGLKEAKDTMDSAETVTQSIKVNDSRAAVDFRRELRNLGCMVY